MTGSVHNVRTWLGRPLTAQKLVPGDTATGIAALVYQYYEYTINFTSGGTVAIVAGTVIKGATSSKTAIVVSVGTITGSWGAGTAAGAMRVKALSGTFTSAENLTVGATADDATMTLLPSLELDTYAYKGSYARAALLSVSGNTALMSCASNPDQTYLMGHSLTSPSSYVLYGPEEIQQAKFIDYTSASASVINVTCFF